MASGTITSWQLDGETVEIVTYFILGGSKITANGDWSSEIERPLGRKVMTNLDSILKSRDINLPRKFDLVKATVFHMTTVYSSHIWMWELNSKESWAPKNRCFWTVVSEKTLESPLDFKETQPVNPKGNQPWKFLGKADTEAKAPILWPPGGKSRLTGKGPDIGKDWKQMEKQAAEDEMAG